VGDEVTKADRTIRFLNSLHNVIDIDMEQGACIRWAIECIERESLPEMTLDDVAAYFNKIRHRCLTGWRVNVYDETLSYVKCPGYSLEGHEALAVAERMKRLERMKARKEAGRG
jgi:hypothetical protein